MQEKKKKKGKKREEVFSSDRVMVAIHRFNANLSIRAQLGKSQNHVEGNGLLGYLFTFYVHIIMYTNSVPFIKYIKTSKEL